MDRIFVKCLFRKRLLLLSILLYWSRDFIVCIRLSVSALCLKYLVFISVHFLCRLFAVLSSTMSQSVELPWLSTWIISVVMYNSHKLLIIESVISKLYRVGHCVTRRRLTNSEWWIVGVKLESIAGDMSASLAVTCAEYLSFQDCQKRNNITFWEFGWIISGDKTVSSSQ